MKIPEEPEELLPYIFDNPELNQLKEVQVGKRLYEQMNKLRDLYVASGMMLAMENTFPIEASTEILKRMDIHLAWVHAAIQSMHADCHYLMDDVGRILSQRNAERKKQERVEETLRWMEEAEKE